MLPAMVMAVATTRGPWCHTTALTAATHGPIPAIHPALIPRPASPRSLAHPRITPAAVTHLLPTPVITNTIRPVTPAVAFPALPFPLAAVPITPAAPRTTPVAASAVVLAAHPQEAPASAAAPTTAATHQAVVLAAPHQAVALPATQVADITAAAATMACIEVRNDLQDMGSNQRPETFSGRFCLQPRFSRASERRLWCSASYHTTSS